MAEETTENLEGKRVANTFRGLLHFPNSIDSSLAKQVVFDGRGTATSLKLGGGEMGAEIDGSLNVSKNIVCNNDLYVTKDIKVSGNINLTGNSLINDINILSSGSSVSIRSLSTLETGKLRIRESNQDYELVFGNPTQVLSSLFSITVKQDPPYNFYIKRNTDNDSTSPLWINRTTGEVTINNLKVDNIITNSKYVSAGQPPNAARNVIPVASVNMFATSGVPDGWHECNGQSIPLSSYPELFSAIGYNYTSTVIKNAGINFQVPDLRSLFVRGWDHPRSGESGYVAKDPNRSLTSSTQQHILQNGSSITYQNIVLMYCIKW